MTRQPSQDSLLGNDDLLAGSGDLLSSGDDDLMASLRKVCTGLVSSHAGFGVRCGAVPGGAPDFV